MPEVSRPVIEVVGDVGLVITVALGLPAAAVHIPVPVAAIETVPVVLQMIWSGPALGLVVTITLAVSVHPFEVHTKPYVPKVLKPVIVVVANIESLMVVADRLVERACQIPVPVPAIVATPIWHPVSSGPAVGVEVTMTLIVSIQVVSDIQI